MLKNLIGMFVVAAGMMVMAAVGAFAQTLTIGVRGGPDSMDPHYSGIGVHADAMKQVFDTLVWSGDHLQLEPGLAQSWRLIDDTIWEFKLRRGVKFHDGSDFTAEDVKFSIERIPKITGPIGLMILVRRVKHVDIIDDYTIHIETHGPAPTLPNDFVRLFIVSSKAAKDYSTKETAAEGFNSGKATIGTGPYKYVSWEPKGDLVLERFDDYWRGKGAWQTVIRKEIPNNSSRLAALKAGQVDLINYVFSADWLTLQADPDVQTYLADSAYVMILQLDQREKTPQVYDLDGTVLEENPLRDPKVREAIDLAIDRDIMVEVVLEGLGKPARQITPEGFFGASDNVLERVYDPEKAKRLLAEAGYPNGFKMDLYCTSDRLPGDAEICQGLGQMFARIGIQTDVNAVTRAVYFPAQGRREYSAFMNGWGTLTGETSYTLSALTHSVSPELNLGSYNRTDYANPDVDRLIQMAEKNLDEDTRRKLYEQAVEKIMIDRVYIPLVNLQTAWAAQKGTLNMVPRTDEDTLAFFITPAN